MRKFDGSTKTIRYRRTPKMNAYVERFNRTIQKEFIDYHEDLACYANQFNRWIDSLAPLARPIPVETKSRCVQNMGGLNMRLTASQIQTYSAGYLASGYSPLRVFISVGYIEPLLR